MLYPPIISPKSSYKKVRLKDCTKNFQSKSLRKIVLILKKITIRCCIIFDYVLTLYCPKRMLKKILMGEKNGKKSCFLKAQNISMLT